MKLQQKTKTDPNGLIPPYGGELKNLIVKDNDLKKDLISNATYEFECSDRNACDVELLMVGAPTIKSSTSHAFLSLHSNS